MLLNGTSTSNVLSVTSASEAAAVNPSILAPFNVDAEKAFFGVVDPQKVLNVVRRRQPISDTNAAGVEIIHHSLPNSYQW